MIQTGRLEDHNRWHIFVGGFQESLCGRVVLWDCDLTVALPDAEAVARLEAGPMCKLCLRKLMRLAEIAEALNGRLP